MYQLVQHRDRSALPPPLLVIVIVTTLLTSPRLAWPSESPTHSSQYDQLKASIEALSGEVNSITSTIDTLKNLQGRTPQTAPHQSHHLQTTIQGLTEKVATLQTQVQGLGGNVTDLTTTVGALALTIKGDTPATGVTQTISKLQDKITKLEGNVDSLSPNQDSHLGLSEVMLSGLGASVITLTVRWLFIDLPTEKKRRAKERLEKFYAPVLGRLQANEDIWDNFKGGILYSIELHLTPEEALGSILRKNASARDEGLNKWVRAMEGIFRQNNEAAEKTILENYGYLRPEDVKKESEFDNERKKYLRHVGEFRAVRHRWDEANKKYTALNWFNRCRTSLGIDITASPPVMPQLDQFLEYFHPTNPYRKEFFDEVQKSYDKLVDEAGLAKKGWFGRLFDRLPNW